MMDVSVPLAVEGARFARRLGLGLAAFGVAVVVLAALTGGTPVAGVHVPGPVAAVSGAALVVLGLLLWCWTVGRREGDGAVWSDGDVLFLHAHAGPVLKVCAEDLKDVTRVRASSSALLRLAFGARMFTVRSDVAVFRGVNEVPVGERFVSMDLDVARDQIQAWVRGRSEGTWDGQ